MCRSEEALGDDIREKIALFANLPVDVGRLRARRRLDLQGAARVPSRGRRRARCSTTSASRTTPPDLSDWEELVRAHRLAPPTTVRIGAGRQVQPARGRLPVGDRGAQPRRHPPRRQGRGALGRLRAAHRRRGRGRARRPATASSSPAASACAASRARSGRPASRASTACPTWASASACRSRCPSSPATWPAWTAPTRPSSTPRRPFPVIDLLPEQKEVRDMGGTMRLGADPVKLHDGTRAREIYGEAVIYERHRHRYEVNNHLRKRLEQAGLVVQRHLARRPPGRGHRAARPPVLRRVAVPPRVQVAPAAPAAAVPRLRGRGARARPRARARGRARGAGRVARVARVASARDRPLAPERLRRRARAPARRLRAALRDREPVAAASARWPTPCAAELRGASASRSRRTTAPPRPARTPATCSRASRARRTPARSCSAPTSTPCRWPAPVEVGARGRRAHATATRRSSAPTTRRRSR